MTVEADPMDAGTDNGFTFTSPNWPTDPKAGYQKHVKNASVSGVEGKGRPRLSLKRTFQGNHVETFI